MGVYFTSQKFVACLGFTAKVYGTVEGHSKVRGMVRVTAKNRGMVSVTENVHARFRFAGKSHGK